LKLRLICVLNDNYDDDDDEFENIKNSNNNINNKEGKNEDYFDVGFDVEEGFKNNKIEK
jgi:hypothetical protein